MPSLEQLETFKASFGAIADEPLALSRLGLPLDDLPLPDTEPAGPPPFIAPSPPPPPPEEERPPDTQAPTEDGVPEPPPPAEAPPAPVDLGLGFDFADLLGGGPANLPSPPAAEAVIEEALARSGPEPEGGGPVLPEGEPGPDGESARDSSAEDAFAPDSEPDFENLPDLSDLPDFDTAAPEDDAVIPGDDAAAAVPEDFGGIDLDAALELPGFEDGETEPGALEGLLDGFADDIESGRDAEPEDGTGEADGMDAFPDMAGELADLGDFGGLDAGLADSPAGEAAPDALEGLPEGFAGGIESGSAAESGDETGETDFGDAFPDMPGLAPAGGDAPEGEAEGAGAADPFENFSPDGGKAGFSDDSGGTVGAGAPQPAAETEFALPGIDDLFGGSGSPMAGMGGAAPAAGSTAPEDTVEEIRLDEYELEQLRNTLSGYPLNLRIAIEEIIAEQAVAPNLMSSLIKLLTRNGSPREAAALAAKILDKPIPIPRGFEKKTGEELEAEQASFRYIFARRFLPVLRIALFVALVSASVLYLGYRFLYTPARANSIYRQGLELIPAGDYAQANSRFDRAFQLHRQKDWFYRYAGAFREERQYIYAEEKYDQLLRHFPGDKKGALDYAAMETNYLRNYAKADRIIRLNLLEYSFDDREGLMALGDNNLIWGEIDPSRYEEARGAYARLLEKYGWQDPLVERMLRYFIRVDNLGEALPLQRYFMAEPERRRISASTLAELGGYLLDKRFEEVQGVPDEHRGQIEGIRDVLLRAVRAAPRLPEAHYHLARYYNRFGNTLEERQTLEIAARAFDVAEEESTRRTRYRLDTQRRLGEILINSREFFAAEEQLVKGAAIYEDALDRRFLSRSPEFGRLYANLGDLEYFAKSGNMPLALEYYLQSELNGWAPPEIQYRIGAAHYQQKQWGPALDRFFAVSSETPANRRLLNALGNVSYMRGDYFNAQSYYTRLVDMLDAERARFPMLMPNDRPEHLELAERMMAANNNLAVSLEALTKATGNRGYRSRALGLYAESARAWDALTRNPDTMIRAGAADLSAPGMNLAFLNSRNTLYPEPGYEPRIYLQIDRDLLEPSDWEKLVPRNFRITDVVEPYRNQ